jgi:hypothetical protein
MACPTRATRDVRVLRALNALVPAGGATRADWAEVLRRAGTTAARRRTPLRIAPARRDSAGWGTRPL